MVGVVMSASVAASGDMAAGERMLGYRVEGPSVPAPICDARTEWRVGRSDGGDGSRVSIRFIAVVDPPEMGADARGDPVSGHHSTARRAAALRGDGCLPPQQREVGGMSGNDLQRLAIRFVHPSAVGLDEHVVDRIGPAGSSAAAAVRTRARGC